MRRAQSSVEFLAVTAIGLVMIVGVSMVILGQSQDNKDATNLGQVQHLGESVLGQAQTVYALGTNSWVTIDANLPDDLQSIYTVENNSLVFELQTKAGVTTQPVFSSIPIMGVNISGDKAYLTMDPLTGGTRKIRVFSNGTIVLLSIT